MTAIAGILKESYFLFSRMAPYLLSGFLFAGILHILVKPDMVSRHLGSNTVMSVIKASLFGIPLPLCSCSVIPAAMSLRREGASRGAVLSFLISTPTTGIDSILATYSLLGGLFTIYRILAAFVTGVLSGFLSNIFAGKDIHIPSRQEERAVCEHCGIRHEASHGFFNKIKGVFTYAFGDLLSDSGLALLAGVIIAGGIAYLIPGNLVENYVGSGLRAMVVMLLIGIPMYVCATASIPIAVSLMMKGVDPGAALVFLIAGPATNIVTMTVIKKDLGKKSLVIYLLSIVVSSFVLGALFNMVCGYFCESGPALSMLPHHQAGSRWLEAASSTLLLGLILYNLRSKKIFSRS